VHCPAPMTAQVLFALLSACFGYAPMTAQVLFALLSACFGLSKQVTEVDLQRTTHVTCWILLMLAVSSTDPTATVTPIAKL
jgi:hypothetical protein